jgi:hypothetical protein
VGRVLGTHGTNCKKILKKVICRSSLNYDELYTILTEVESIVNDRPITYVYVDCERSLLSAGLDFQACERKGGTADNTSINEIRVAHTTQNSHWSNRYACQSNLIRSNYELVKMQTDRISQPFPCVIS